MLKEYCQDKGKIIDAALAKFIPREQKYLDIIFEAMRYSLFAGGKRLRPVLLMASADAVGGNGNLFINMACGLEMIHTYSLIHDDLPAMDNDDYRRGKLTNHKVFGEGMAVLAGDALLTAAFEVMLSQTGVAPAALLPVIREISVAAGPAGMVGGQAIDLKSAGKSLDLPALQFMHQAKTGALFRAAIRGGAMLAGATPQQVDQLTRYAEEFGLAFQITDDILDVIGTQEKIGKPVGSDIRNHKATYVTLYSLPTAQQLAQQAVQNALAALVDFGGEADMLRAFVKYLISRDR
ncbi:MAG: polyprenyl synthetase family protein [Veillonellales bacterium]